MNHRVHAWRTARRNIGGALRLFRSLLCVDLNFRLSIRSGRNPAQAAPLRPLRKPNRLYAEGRNHSRLLRTVRETA